MARDQGFVASADSRATSAGLDVLRAGGNAVDAAIATNAVLAVTAPHLCGLGGDLFALVFAAGRVECLEAAGPAGELSDPEAMRSEGRRAMPLFNDLRSVTVPGCVDGLVALHERFGSHDLAGLFAAATALAEHGFEASTPLAEAIARLDAAALAALAELADQASAPGALVQRPGVARALGSVADQGRDGFYRGEFGAGLVEMPGATITATDLERSCSRWVEPLHHPAWGVELWVAPPPSQGYLFAASAALASALVLPDPDDPAWSHLLVECATAAGFDRPDVLFDGADGAALLARATGRGRLVDQSRASGRRLAGGPGDTTYLCTLDGQGMAVSLIQSNASGLGAKIAEPSTQINLHNRGLGFNLIPGHPAELQPERRPPHTLVPAMATDDEGLRAVLGTMGGDAQPQILLQVAARLFRHRQHPREAIGAGRWALQAASGFDTWTADRVHVAVEGNAPSAWADGLAARGHDVVVTPPMSAAFGHAMAITRLEDDTWAAAADPRTVVGSWQSTAAH